MVKAGILLVWSQRTQVFTKLLISINYMVFIQLFNCDSVVCHILKHTTQHQESNQNLSWFCSIWPVGPSSKRLVVVLGLLRLCVINTINFSAMHEKIRLWLRVLSRICRHFISCSVGLTCVDNTGGLHSDSCDRSFWFLSIWIGSFVMWEVSNQAHSL
jgi:hypothetical protein